MRYAAGEELALNNKKVVKIREVNDPVDYTVKTKNGMALVTEDFIDHDATVELQQQKAHDEYKKALMKFGRVEGDNLDIKPNKYARHKEITEQMHITYKAKNKDYGNSFEVVHKELGAVASLGQIAHKYNRLKNIILNNNDISVKDETVKDTVLDLANYLIMFYMLIEEETE